MAKVQVAIKQQKKPYDWKITAQKFGKALLYVVLAGVAAKYGESNWYLMLAPSFVAIENVIKNW